MLRVKYRLLIFAQKQNRFYLVYCIVLLFGIATLLPWNIFITATSYFVDYKLNTTETNVSTWYRKDFTYWTGIIGQATNVLMNLINIIISIKFSSSGGYFKEENTVAFHMLIYA